MYSVDDFNMYFGETFIKYNDEVLNIMFVIHEGEDEDLNYLDFWPEVTCMVNVIHPDGTEYDVRKDINIQQSQLWVPEGYVNTQHTCCYMGRLPMRFYKKAMHFRYVCADIVLSRYLTEEDYASKEYDLPNLIEKMYNPKYLHIQQALEQVQSLERLAASWHPDWCVRLGDYAYPVIEYKRTVVGYVHDGIRLCDKAASLTEHLSEFTEVA